MNNFTRGWIIPADDKLSAEIHAEHSARQQIEHEPKRRQPIRRLKVEIKQQPTKNAKHLTPPHPPAHQIAQPRSVVRPHPRHLQLLLSSRRRQARGSASSRVYFTVP